MKKARKNYTLKVTIACNLKISRKRFFQKPAFHLKSMLKLPQLDFLMHYVDKKRLDSIKEIQQLKKTSFTHNPHPPN